MENKNNITGYKLKQWFESKSEEKTAILKLEKYYGLSRMGSILEIELDNEDVQQLLDKYKISKIEEKEIELSNTVKKLSQIEKDLTDLKMYDFPQKD